MNGKHPNDTTHKGIESRVLVFKYPGGAIGRERELLTEGPLMNGKRNGFWTVIHYRFMDNMKVSSVSTCKRTDLYFNDYLLFDASDPLDQGNLLLDFESNTMSLDFTYAVETDTVDMKIFCEMDSVKNYYNCSLKADTTELVRVKSSYLDME